MHFTEVPKSDEQFQKAIHCTQKSSCLPLFISTDPRGRLQKLKSYIKPHLNPCLFKRWKQALHMYYFVDSNANLFGKISYCHGFFVNSYNFRILVPLIMGKLLPVTTIIWFCFCSKEKKRYFFHYTSFQCVWRRSPNCYCCLIKLSSCSEQKYIRQGLACISFSGQKEHDGCELKMRLYQTEQKVDVVSNQPIPSFAAR